MLTLSMQCSFARGYIADPYWPQRAKLIDIQKESGMNRARSAANRRKSLEEYLNVRGMTLEEYDRIEREAQEPFYRDEDGEIIISEHHVMSFLVSTTYQARSANRPCAPEQVRSRFIVTPWSTGKTHPDGVWERFVTVTAGTGAKLSNQRGLRANQYIEKFVASGKISYDPDFVDTETLKRSIVWGGQFVGIGASRKMGWGRFEAKFE